MTRERYYSGSATEDLAKYCRAIRDGEWLYVSGTIGVNPLTGTMPDSAELQTRAIFTIIEGVLDQAQMTIGDVLRCRVFVTDNRHLEDVIKVLAERFNHARPANTTIICQLPVPGAKVEIEITARKET